MTTPSGTSPTLTLKIVADDALAKLGALKLALGQAGHSQEFQEGLRRTQAEKDAAVRVLLAQEAKLQQETLNLKEVGAAKADALAKKTAGYRLQVEIESGKMTFAAWEKAYKAQETANAAHQLNIQKQDFAGWELRGALAQEKRVQEQVRDLESWKVRGAIQAEQQAQMQRRDLEAWEIRGTAAQARRKLEEVRDLEHWQIRGTIAAEKQAQMQRRDLEAWEIRGAAAQARRALEEKRDLEMWEMRGAIARAGAAATLRAEAGQGLGRSLTRGVAGAAGLNMLTYGASIPAVVAGFGAAATVGASIKQGSEFQYQTAFSGALGQMSPDELKHLREELRAMGTDSIYGPLELAKGMRILEQAGVGASEAMKILPVSMKVALQGETDLTKASETLVGVMRQFKLEYKDIPAIGDAISKTAAVTQANIPSLMAALKAATGLSRYGVDLNTTLAGIGMLAKQGIVNESAGTFFRRFVEDLYAPKSDGARRAMREMNFTTSNKDGTLRPYRDVQEDFVSKMQKYDPQSQVAMMSQILDIRAAKQGAALVTDMAGEFKRLRKEIDDSKGSLDLFWKAMSGETKLLWEEVKSNFSNTVIGAFSTIEDPIKTLLGDMKEFFKSPEVKGFLNLLLMIPAGYAGIASMVLKAKPAPINSALLPGPLGVMGTVNMLGKMWDATEQANPAAVRASGKLKFVTGSETAIVPDLPAAAAGGKKAPRFILDPLGAKEALQLSQAQDRESEALMARESKRISQQANYAVKIQDELHKYKLTSELQYTVEIERIESDRRLSEIALANQAIDELKSRMREKMTPAQREDSERRQADIAAKRDDLVRESYFQEDIRKIREKGKKKEFELRTAEEATKIREDIAKIGEDLHLRQREAREAQNMALMQPVEAARAAAGLGVERAYQNEKVKLQKELALLAEREDELSRSRKGVLAAEIALLPEKLAVEKAIAENAAEDIVKRQRSLEYGANAAFTAYINAAEDAGTAAGSAITKGLKAGEDALVQFGMTGKMTFSNFANAVISDMLRMAVQARITKPLAEFGQGLLNQYMGSKALSTDTGYGGADFFTSAVASANGNVFSSPSISALSGGVYNSPTFFRFANGGVLGEAGYEAVMPLKRGSDGKLGVSGGGAPNVILNITNASGTPVAAKQTGPAVFDGENYIVGVVLSAVENNPHVRSALAGALR